MFPKSATIFWKSPTSLPFVFGLSTKKSNKTGAWFFLQARRAPPPAGLVYKYSETKETKTPAIAASKEFPPSFKIFSAASTVSLCPPAIVPNAPMFLSFSL